MAWQVKRTRKDGTRTIRVAWHDKDLDKPQSETFLAVQKQDADSFLRDVEAAGNRWPKGWVAGKGYPPASPNPSGYNVRAACIKAVEVNRRANRGTKADYLREIDRYLPESDPLASMFAEDADIEAVEEWHSRLEETLTQPGGPEKGSHRKKHQPQPLSTKTRRNAHSRLSAGLALMVRYGHIPLNPATGLGPSRSNARKVQALTPEEYTALLGYIPDHYQPFVELLARTGMRFSEATALTVRRVTLTKSSPTIYVQEAWKREEDYSKQTLGTTKSEQGMRIVPIDNGLAEMIRPLLQGKKAGDLVFVTQWGYVLRHNNFYQRIWRPAVRKADKEGAISFRPTIHDLRHAHATWLLTDGVPVPTVADRLGHDPAVLLRVYSHLIGDSRTAAATTIGGLLGAGAPKVRSKPKASSRSAASGRNEGNAEKRDARRRRKSPRKKT